MKAVVTGGAGFVGSHIAEALLAQGHDVHVVDDCSTGHRRNVPAGAVLHEGSILDARILDAAMQGATTVFHQAALPSVPRSIEDPEGTHDANATGTLRVLQAARRAGAAKLVYAASSSAYGDTPTLPKVETMPPQPRSPYAAAKLAGEQYCQAFWHSYGLPTTCLRYFNVYGPRQDPNGAYAAVIPRFIQAALRGDPLTIHGDGTQTRDFTYVGDVVQANLLAAVPGRGDGGVFNVGRGQATTLLRLAATVQALVGPGPPPRHLPERQGDVRHSLASVASARRHLGFAPRTDLEAGLRATLAAARTVAVPP